MRLVTVLALRDAEAGFFNSRGKKMNAIVLSLFCWFPTVVPDCVLEVEQMIRAEEAEIAKQIRIVKRKARRAKLDAMKRDLAINYHQRKARTQAIVAAQDASRRAAAQARVKGILSRKAESRTTINNARRGIK